MLLACGGVVLAQPEPDTPAKDSPSSTGQEGTQPERTTPAENSPSSKEQGAEKSAPGKLIVKLKEEAPSSSLEELNNRYGAKTDKELAPNLVPGLNLITLPPGLAVADAKRGYEASNNVEYADPDFIRSRRATPNDTYYKNGSLWGLNKIGMPRAWDVTTGDTSNPLVAIIDDGVYTNHLDLKGNLWVNPGETKNGVDDDGNGFVDDINGLNAIQDNGTVYVGPNQDYHATPIAGIIGAVANNGTGVTGVNWQTDIMSCKWLGKVSGKDSDAIQCLDYVTTMATKLNKNSISNNSWGGPQYNRALCDAIKGAGDKGHLFVAAADESYSFGPGPNTDSTADYPIWCYDSADTTKTQLANIIAVTASDRNDTRPLWAASGTKKIHVAAPGVSIVSTESGGNYYGSEEGTSFAAPHVAGTAALIWAKKPSLTVQEVRNIITKYGNMDHPLTLQGAPGRLNADKALHDPLLQ